MELKRTNRFDFVIWLFVMHINFGSGMLYNSTNTISSSQNPYTNKSVVPHILSRKKRYLLFPSGSAFVATMSFAKALASDYPRGVNLVTEVDFYYPMYSSIAELFPKEKTPKPVTTSKPKTPSNPTPPMTMMPKPKFDAFPGTYIDDDNSWRRNDFNKYSKYHNKDYIPLNPKYISWQSASPNFVNWQSTKPLTRSWHKPFRNVWKPYYESPETESKKNFYPSKNRDWSWRQRELYRSRRDLYSHIEGMALNLYYLHHFYNVASVLTGYGFDISTCIHRMICEGRHYLLPPGVSFFQDVLRILFTLPVNNDTEDGYSKAMQASENECTSIYSVKCPYSIIGYFIHTQQEQNK